MDLKKIQSIDADYRFARQVGFFNEQCNEQQLERTFESVYRVLYGKYRDRGSRRVYFSRTEQERKSERKIWSVKEKNEREEVRGNKSLDAGALWSKERPYGFSFFYFTLFFFLLCSFYSVLSCVYSFYFLLE